MEGLTLLAVVVGSGGMAASAGPEAGRRAMGEALEGQAGEVQCSRARMELRLRLEPVGTFAVDAVGTEIAAMVMPDNVLAVAVARAGLTVDVVVTELTAAVVVVD